jgi:hypothetical protein
MAIETQKEKLLEAYLSEVVEEKRQGFTLANLFLKLDSYERKHRALERRMDTSEENEVMRDERIDLAYDRLDAHRTAIVESRRRERDRHSSHNKGDEFPETELDTGKFDLVEIQHEVAERSAKRRNSERVRALEDAETMRRENSTWWKRHAITVISTIVGALLLSLIVSILTLAVTGARQQNSVVIPR